MRCVPWGPLIRSFVPPSSFHVPSAEFRPLLSPHVWLVTFFFPKRYAICVSSIFIYWKPLSFDLSCFLYLFFLTWSPVTRWVRRNYVFFCVYYDKFGSGITFSITIFFIYRIIAFGRLVWLILVQRFVIYSFPHQLKVVMPRGFD